VGFRILDAFAAKHAIDLGADRWAGLFGSGRVGEREAACLKPQTFMNDSGRAVRLALDGLQELDPARDLMVVYDDLDLAFGRLRLRSAGGAGGHRGVESIIEATGSSDFPRLRFGVGRPTGSDVSPADYVLAPFADEEASALGGRIDEAVAAVEAFIGEGIGPAMDRFNGAQDPGDPMEASMAGGEAGDGEI